MDAQFMTLRCDHCRRQLGPGIHRYWQMRFCSPVCIAAYQERLDETTKAKIQRLDFPVPKAGPNGGWRWLGDVMRHLPG